MGLRLGPVEARFMKRRERRFPDIRPLPLRALPVVRVERHEGASANHAITTKSSMLRSKDAIVLAGLADG